ncbi:MAG TPA: nucleoside 2-deoxyribosyltransferase [Planctomycetota bacterium]|nr:nucleoside 2-deoxyribosyltransferase [Planctomycetota bacterium]
MDQSPPRIPKVYLAAPLFTQHERRWNRELARRLEQQVACSVVLPQDFKVGDCKNHPKHFGEIFRLCIEGVRDCDAVVAVLDGADADSGTCFEAGYAYALGKPIVGVRTDYRAQHERGTNLMLARGCHAFVRRPAFDEDLDGLVGEVARKLKRLLPR